MGGEKPVKRRERTGRGRSEERGMPGKRARLRTGGILAALIAAAAVFIVMVQSEKKVLTQYEKGIIITAVQAIPRGTVMTEENRELYVKVQELDKSCIPDTALSDMGQVQGLAAAYDIDSGTLLTEGMFHKMDLILSGMEEPVVAGFKADDISQVADGILRDGDRIDIYSVREEETVCVWNDVIVQEVFDASGSRIPAGDKTTAAQRINVYLDRAQTAAFYRELAAGSLRVVKICDSEN
jgi:hypothetical protein